MSQNPEWRERVRIMRDRYIQAKPRICLERLRHMTDVYERNPSAPEQIRKALAFQKVLQCMPIKIDDIELIVGNVSSKMPRGALISPEYSLAWVDEVDTIDTRPLDRMYLTDEEKEELKAYVPRWKGKTPRDRFNTIAPEEISSLLFRLMQHTTGLETGRGHTAVQFDKVLSIGLEGVRAEVETALEAKDPSTGAPVDNYFFYRAALITIDAVITFAKRYSELAAEMADVDDVTAGRKAELQRIAEVCARVPAKPARSFYEALQCVWFIIIACIIEDPIYGYIPGRLDQLLYSYYVKDIADGMMTKDEILEIVEHWFIKINEPQIPLRTAAARIFTGQPMAHNITLGGLKPDGTDATNELSYLFIDAEMDVKLPQPDLMFRIHEKTPTSFLLKACELARDRVGKSKFLMDDCALKCLQADGKPIEDCRDYVLIGCMQPFVPGKHNIVIDGSVNSTKCLELTLNNGIDPVTGMKFGIETGDPTTFKTYDEFWEAYCAQIANACKIFVRLSNIVMDIADRLNPIPFQSTITEGCIERGGDIGQVGTIYNNRGSLITGPVTVGDSLAVIKKLVFEEKAVTMRDLLDAIKADYAGYDELLDRIAAVPKFGNDNMYVDSLVNDVITNICDEFGKYRDRKGAQYIVAIQAVTGNISYGEYCGATPDGRRAGAPLNDGISPVQGRNVNGASATIKSVCHVDLSKAIQGSVFNLTLSPDFVNTPEKLKKFADLIQTYRALGGYLVQFNIVDAETLRDAQKHPEKYRELTVRVSTYSSFFVELSKDVQNDIISRLEMTTY